MRTNESIRIFAILIFGLFGSGLNDACCASAQTPSLAPTTMLRIGAIEERYQSYNIEMLEVTGGKFWKPYGPELSAALNQSSSPSGQSGNDTPSGMNPALYQYRPPIDLTNARLRKLAAALGPAYVRVRNLGEHDVFF